MGFAGNTEPQFIIPSLIATKETGQKKGMDDLDFFIGDEAVANQKTYGLTYPIRKGQVEDWDLMERFWEQSIFKYLRCEPEDHYFLLVRKPFSNTDKNISLQNNQFFLFFKKKDRTSPQCPRKS